MKKVHIGATEFLQKSKNTLLQNTFQNTAKKMNKSSAVAEMGDRGHNRHGTKIVSDIAIFVLKRDVKLQLTNMGLKGGGCCAPFMERWEPV